MSVDAWPAGLPTRLRPVEVLGRGAQGVVWAARDTAAGRDVAVKLIAAPEADRFETEARALARLRDVPGIVGVIELGRTARGVGWLVTELVPGGTLADRGQSTLRVPELAAIGERLASGLAIAHERGVHHGDITPANVVLDAHGRAELVDFAMASLDAEPGRPPGCTPRFAAPERLRGAAPDPASDVHTLAATLTWAAAFCDADASEPRGDDAVAADLRTALDVATAERATQRPGAPWLAERFSRVLDGSR